MRRTDGGLSKDYEIVHFHKDGAKNQAAIEAFLARYIRKPFEYLENVVGVELNFNKIFYQPEKLRDISTILSDLANIDGQLKLLEQEILL